MVHRSSGDATRRWGGKGDVTLNLFQDASSFHASKSKILKQVQDDVSF